jgi:uncharacterized membrane protein YfcA
MNNRIVVSSTTVAVSLLAYWYARSTNKDVVPVMLIGGFIGSLAGEYLASKK